MNSSGLAGLEEGAGGWWGQGAVISLVTAVSWQPEMKGGKQDSEKTRIGGRLLSFQLSQQDDVVVTMSRRHKMRRWQFCIH